MSIFGNKSKRTRDDNVGEEVIAMMKGDLQIPAVALAALNEGGGWRFLVTWRSTQFGQ